MRLKIDSILLALQYLMRNWELSISLSALIVSIGSLATSYMGIIQAYKGIELAKEAQEIQVKTYILSKTPFVNTRYDGDKKHVILTNTGFGPAFVYSFHMQYENNRVDYVFKDDDETLTTFVETGVMSLLSKQIKSEYENLHQSGDFKYSVKFRYPLYYIPKDTDVSALVFDLKELSDTAFYRMFYGVHLSVCYTDISGEYRFNTDGNPDECPTPPKYILNNRALVGALSNNPTNN